ncbi:hypothetical protein N7463_009276, partial [Penicillium fimorum]
MRLYSSLVLYLAIITGSHAILRSRSYQTRDYFALQLPHQASPEDIALRLGLQHEGPIGELPNHYAFSIPKYDNVDIEKLLNFHRESHNGSEPLWATKLSTETALQKRIPPQAARTSDTRFLEQPDPSAVQSQDEVVSILGIHDPFFREQWHLINTVQPGNDLNITGVWLDGVTGEGVTVAIIDDGLDISSQDLAPNYYARGSYDFNDHNPEPRPRLPDDHHGTLCAAEIAAAKNHICGVGVAYNSQVSGIRMLSGPVDDMDQAAAINYDYQNNHIYSCSWGPEDNGQTMKAPGVLVQRAIVNGVQNGRGGKGSIFVFSAGNGASYDDDCNFDGYTNSIYSITVGAIDRMDTHPRYAESCSAQLVVAYSSGHGHGIYSTDNGDNCFSLHSGTSAAGPLAAGVIALALNVRPELTWRDVQYLMVETANPVHTSDGSWQHTPGGRMFSHDWGYGKLDAYALVQRARSWELVKPQAWFHSSWQNVNHEIFEGPQGLSSYYEVSSGMIRAANLAQLEHVTVTINVNHTSRGDLSVELVSPNGVVSYLSTPRMPDQRRTGYQDWEFMSVAHWGESGIGTWRVIVKDTNVNGHTGTFINWRLNLWGEATDGSNQSVHLLPGEFMEYGTEIAVIKTASLPTSTAAVNHPSADGGSAVIKTATSPASTTTVIHPSADGGFGATVPASRPWTQLGTGPFTQDAMLVYGALLGLLALCSTL